jgi:hypothetical protein
MPARGTRSGFGVWIDGEYVRGFGEPPTLEYGAALLELKETSTHEGDT